MQTTHLTWLERVWYKYQQWPEQLVYCLAKHHRTALG